MREKKIIITLHTFDRADEMPADEQELIAEAKKAVDKAYAPYSNFKVGSAALLVNGEILSAANQENASYPVCVCSEVALLSACSSVYPGTSIRKIAITTKGANPSDSPKAPCGQCRQTLLEFEKRSGNDIEIIMTGASGEVYKAASARDLLPLHFSGLDL